MNLHLTCHICNKYLYIGYDSYYDKSTTQDWCGGDDHYIKILYHTFNDEIEIDIFIKDKYNMKIFNKNCDYYLNKEKFNLEIIYYSLAKINTPISTFKGNINFNKFNYKNIIDLINYIDKMKNIV